MTVSYDGSGYYGFQKQVKEITVEAMLNQALKKVYKKDVKIIASGRTDRGVHALGQVVHFDAPSHIESIRLIKALNSYLPLDIRIIDIKETDDKFHARFDATRKTYRYIITRKYDLFNRNYHTYIPYELDPNKMSLALKQFIGTHDFFGFSAYVKNKPTVKTIIDASMEIKDETIIITITGDNFLRYMVRKIVGTIIEIGMNKKDINVINEIFNTRNTRLCGKTASPNGLYLVKVYYE